MSIIKFPQSTTFPIELFASQPFEIFASPADTWQSIPVRAVIPELADGSVEFGPFLLTPAEALAVADALAEAARYATPISSDSDGDLYRALPDGSE